MEAPVAMIAPVAESHRDTRKCNLLENATLLKIRNLIIHRVITVLFKS